MSAPGPEAEGGEAATNAGLRRLLEATRSEALELRIELESCRAELAALRASPLHRAAAAWSALEEAVRLRVPERLRPPDPDLALLRASGLFYAAWHLGRYPGARRLGVPAARAYLAGDWRRHPDPNPLFDGTWYLRRHPMAALPPRAPVIHYARYGWREGLDPSPWFDTDWYAARNPDWSREHPNPLAHFLASGARAGLDASPGFSSARYLAAYPETAGHRWGALGHYLEFGRGEGREVFPLD